MIERDLSSSNPLAWNHKECSKRPRRDGYFAQESVKIKAMGIMNWFAGKDRKRDSDVLIADVAAQPKVQFSLAMDINRAVEITGTTTVARDAVTTLVTRHALPDRGMLECAGTLQRETDNPVDPKAVAVHIEGERMGYLPSYVARDLPLPAGEAWPVQAQLFSIAEPKGARARAWVWLDQGAPQWEYSVGNPPPLTIEEKRLADQKGRSEMVTEALSEGGERAADFRSGMVKGVHYLELIEPIKQLKREGRLREALELCYAAIEGAERSSKGREPAPWYTEQAAIIHRKLKEGAEEITVLERWLKRAPAALRKDSAIAEGLAKLQG